MHKEIVQAQVKVGDGKYVIVECPITKVDAGDNMVFTANQAKRYNQGLTLEAQAKLRDAYKSANGLKTATSATKELTKGEEVSISID